MLTSRNVVLCSLLALSSSAYAGAKAAPGPKTAIAIKHEAVKRIIRDLRDSVEPAPVSATKLELANGAKVLATRGQWNRVIIFGKEAAEPGVMTVLNAKERVEVRRMLAGHFNPDIVEFRAVARDAFKVAYLKEMSTTSRSARNELAIRALKE